MLYDKKGTTAKRLLIITHERLLSSGIRSEEYYSSKELAEKLKVSRAYFSTLLLDMPYEEEYFQHPNPNIEGRVKMKVFKGEHLLLLFAARDKHYGVETSNVHTK